VDHPSFEGVWSTDDLRSVPLNRPTSIGSRATLTPDEFIERAKNNESGRDFTINVGTFLSHEYGIRTFGYSSLVVDPPDGRMPALTPAGEALAATRSRRFTRVDPEMIEYLATVDDRVAYAAPFTLRLMISARPDYEMYEYSCHQGNGAVANSLSGERTYERDVAAAIANGLPIPPRAGEHKQIRNGPAEGVRLFDINAGE
jgi:hypothetical protein